MTTEIRPLFPSPAPQRPNRCPEAAPELAKRGQSDALDPGDFRPWRAKP